MKIYIPQKAKDGIGGGWTFTRNFIAFCEKHADVELVDNPNDCDIYFIPGATMSQRDEVTKAKENGSKIVLRVDNIPRNSRNRGTGTPRLYDFGQIADEVIYQSEWARDFISPFLNRQGEVIINGTNDFIFKPEGYTLGKEGKPQYLYSQLSSDPLKRWEKAWYWFQKSYFLQKESHLWIVGRPEFFGKDQLEYKFDFFGGAENRVRCLGVIEDPNEMAKIYRSADFLLMSADMDACSNVLVEARMCGTKIVTEGNENTSIREIMNTPLEELTLKAMGDKYIKVFEKVCTRKVDKFKKI